MKKVGNEKEDWVAAKAPEANLPLDPPMASDVAVNMVATNVKVEENRDVSNLQLERGILLPGNRDSDAQETSQLYAIKDSERTRREEAATKAQAVFRGYLVIFGL